MEEARPTKRAIRNSGTWIAGGIGVAALAGSIGLGLSVRSTYNRCERDVCDEDTKDSIRLRSIVADTLMAGAIAGATTAAILYLRSARSNEPNTMPPSVDVTPTVGGALVGMHGRF